MEFFGRLNHRQNCFALKDDVSLEFINANRKDEDNGDDIEVFSETIAATSNAKLNKALLVGKNEDVHFFKVPTFNIVCIWTFNFKQVINECFCRHKHQVGVADDV